MLVCSLPVSVARHSFLVTSDTPRASRGSASRATVLAFCWCWTRDEDHQPFSIEAQDLKLNAYIASQDDWRALPDCNFTGNQSGYTLECPSLQRALTLARAGRCDVLLVAKVDRLSRSIRGFTRVLDDLDTAGVAFHSATEPFDTATPAGRMMVQMLGVRAEFERQSRSCLNVKQWCDTAASATGGVQPLRGGGDARLYCTVTV